MIVKKVNRLDISTLDKLEAYPIENQNWKEYFNKDVKASLKIGYLEDKIGLLFDVSEKELISNTQANNEAVYKDSCVEFFLKGEDSFYVNFEFSLSLCALVQKGDDRENREFYSNDKINTIKREIFRSQGSWRLFAQINLREFDLLKENQNIEDVKFKANAYCCNEGSQIVHYLSLFPIKSKCPNFHLKNFFENLEFKS